MKIVSSKEVIEDGLTYIVETFDNGTINKYLKPEPQPEQKPQQKLVTNEDIDQKLTDTQNLLLDTMSGVAEMYELLAETQNLQLDTMSGIAEMYELTMLNSEIEGSN